MRILSLVCIPVISVALLFGAGCNSKVGECNKLIGVMNTEGGKLKVSGADPAALKKMADDLDASSKTIGAVELSIPELVKYRDDAKKVFTDVAAGARSSAQAVESKDLAKVGSSMKVLSESAQANSKLVSDINAFCQAK
jgi:hypothetical protein